MSKLTFPYIPVKQTNKKFILTRLPAGVLTNISYTAVRGTSNEEGAVQRMLSSRRITSVKNFTLDVGEYPGDIILNWVGKDNQIKKENGHISFLEKSMSAQILDGQHRLAGIKAAIKDNPKIAKLELPVVIYENLNSRDCADIFLSINTEQKVAPRSLVFDLYGIASKPIVDPALVRARDIVISLNEDENSPYYNNIKLPGFPRKRGGIALSTAITAIKPLVEEKGAFEQQMGVTELKTQEKIILNFFTAIRNKIKKKWDNNSNVFQYASGFVGAIDFLRIKIIPYCDKKNSATVETISKVIQLDGLIDKSEVKGLSGKNAQRKIYDLLVDSSNFDKKIMSLKSKPYNTPHKANEYIETVFSSSEYNKAANIISYPLDKIDEREIISRLHIPSDYFNMLMICWKTKI